MGAKNDKLVQSTVRLSPEINGPLESICFALKIDKIDVIRLLLRHWIEWAIAVQTATGEYPHLDQTPGYRYDDARQGIADFPEIMNFAEIVRRFSGKRPGIVDLISRQIHGFGEILQMIPVDGDHVSQNDLDPQFLRSFLDFYEATRRTRKDAVDDRGRDSHNSGRNRGRAAG